MDQYTLTYLLGLAAFTGAVHTLMGPDHYIPFVAMARAGRWSLARTMTVTVACGLAHILSSVVLGTIGVAVGLAVGGLEAVEAFRGEVAAWLLLGFGLAYMLWGIRRAILNRPHGHLHLHPDLTVHRHTHGEDTSHTHAATDPARNRGSAAPPRSTMTTWALFTIFIFGPCEVLIPQLMYPAAQQSWWVLALVVAVFGLTTLATMTAVVAVGYLGFKKWSLHPLERYGHATAGFALFACGLAIKLGL